MRWIGIITAVYALGFFITLRAVREDLTWWGKLVISALWFITAWESCG